MTVTYTQTIVMSMCFLQMEDGCIKTTKKLSLRKYDIEYAKLSVMSSKYVKLFAM